MSASLLTRLNCDKCGKVFVLAGTATTARRNAVQYHGWDCPAGQGDDHGDTCASCNGQAEA